MHKNAVVIATLVLCIILVMCIWPLGYVTGLAEGAAGAGAANAEAALRAGGPEVASSATPAKKSATRVTRSVLA